MIEHVVHFRLPRVLRDVFRLRSTVCSSEEMHLQPILRRATMGMNEKTTRDEPNIWATSDWLTVNTQEQVPSSSTANRSIVSSGIIVKSSDVCEVLRQSTRSTKGMATVREMIQINTVHVVTNIRSFIIDGL